MVSIVSTGACSTHYIQDEGLGFTIVQSQAWLAFVQASLFPQKKSKNTLKLIVLKCTFKYSFLSIKPEPNMLKILPIIPSSTSQKIPIVLILFTYYNLLFPYYSFALMFQVLTSRETHVSGP